MQNPVSVGEFEDFIIKSSTAKNADDLFALLISSLEKQGYDRVIFSVVNDQDLTLKGRSLGIFQNYPEDWYKYYTEKKFYQIDPVIRYGAVTTIPFKWNDIAQNMILSDRQNRLLQHGDEAGLHNGILIPIRGVRGQLSGMGLASSQKLDACEPNLDLINAYCQQFFLCYKRLFTITPLNEKISGATLSPKESLILTWAANGKTDEEIATILTLSRHTVDTHMRHIFQKLDVSNRIQAVVKGIMMGMIAP